MKAAKLVFLILLIGLVMPVFAHADVTFKWGGAERARYELWKNWKDMDNDQLDNRSFFRFKTSLWGQTDFSKDFSMYAKLTNEFKAYTYFAPSSTKTSGQNEKNFKFDINEVCFDNLYADFKNVFDQPVDVRFGRQDFLGTYGEGFLIMDGTPQDGSRTFYFNALKTSWRANDKNTVDFIYINDPRDDIYLPIINQDKSPQNLNTTNEEAYVAYWKNNDIKKLAFEGYYIFKREASDSGSGFQAKSGRINTIGSYAKYDMSPWTLRGQLAGQFGNYGDQDRVGLGGYAYIDRDFKNTTWQPTTSLGFIYLSGDKQSSTKNEGWDPLFSRYPWISELYVMSMSAETGISGYWTNLSAIRLQGTLQPFKKTKVTLDYNYLWANQETVSSSILSGDGKGRGHLFQGKVEYTISKNISTYFLAEYLKPGDYYANKDAGVFLRSEVQVKF